MTSDDREKVGMNARRRADDVAARQPPASSREVAHPPARFSHQQGSCRDIPRRQVHLEESVEHARRGVGQIERGGARAPHALGDGDYVLKDRAVRLDELLCAKGKAGGQE